MTYTTTTIQEFLAGVLGFSQLSAPTIARLLPRFQLLRYRMGQAIAAREKMPVQISILYEGQVRYLGYDLRTKMPVTLQRLEPGDMVGWAGLVRDVPCETAIASTEVICITLPATDFEELLEQEPEFAAVFRKRCSVIETFDLLGAELERQPINRVTNLKELVLDVTPEAVVMNLPKGRTATNQLDPSLVWLVSGGGTLANHPVGSLINLIGGGPLVVAGHKAAVLLGSPASAFVYFA